jgi:MFS family permease
MTVPVRLGLRANAGQFAILVGLNALVGGMVGLERSVLPIVGKQDFGLRSSTAILAFVVAFGAAKALTNLAAGDLAERLGRKRLLVAGWAVALPVPLLIALAPSWWVFVAANLLLGVNQGLAWSMTVVMKIDLAGPHRRGLALGLNESAGYLGLAATAFATGVLAATYAPRTVVWVGAAALAVAGLLISIFTVRDTGAHVAYEQAAHGDGTGPRLRLAGAFVQASVRDPVLRACSQAGLVNNLNDALAWGLAPLYLAAHGASVREIAVVAAVYPVIWGAGQLLTGWLSDHVGRKPLIGAGMLVQAGALGLLVVADGAFGASLGAAALLGAGTAMVYPTLLAAVSDASQPRDRARVVGVYRFWRDFGFVVGALVAGVVADATSSQTAIVIVAALTAVSGLLVALTPWRPSRSVAEHGRTVADPVVQRRRAGELRVEHELRLVQLAGVEADRAHEELAACLRELAEQPLERRAALARLAVRLAGKPDPHRVLRQPDGDLLALVEGGRRDEERDGHALRILHPGREVHEHLSVLSHVCLLLEDRWRWRRPGRARLLHRACDAIRSRVGTSQGYA